ncbi:O-antigen ligase family protein [Methylomonas sp. MgM2]
MPKTVFLWLFIVFSAVSIWAHKANFRWQLDDGLLLIWMVSGFVVALFAGIHHKEWGGATGILTLALFFLVIKNISLSDKLKRIITLIVLVSTLLATVEGLWQLLVIKQHKALELHSVGHVNHSAIYLVLNFALALAMTLTLRKSDALAAKIFVWFCLLTTAACIVLSNSRASALTMVVIAMSFGLVWLGKSKRPLLVIALSIVAVFSGLYFENARVVEKHLRKTSHGDMIGERQAIWNSSLLAWRRFPWFGVGIKNFDQATEELQRQWLAEEGKTYLEGRYRPYAHAHNFYLSALAEQGLFGFSVIMLIIGRIGFLLYKHRPGPVDADSYWCCWMAALGAVEVVLVNGLFNTTLHHEHGLLTLLLIGIWWSGLDQRRRV